MAVRHGAAFMTLAVLVAPHAHAAADKDRPAVMRGVLDCRAIAAPDARLACFDRTVAVFAKAEEDADLIVVDREKVRETRRTLFGLALPRLAIFEGHGKDGRDEPEFTQIDAVIARTSVNPYGKWTMILQDGARWVQIDDRALSRDPKPGMKIHIRMAAMGSFLANVDGQIAIRARREN